MNLNNKYRALLFSGVLNTRVTVSVFTSSADNHQGGVYGHSITLVCLNETTCYRSLLKARTSFSG